MSTSTLPPKPIARPSHPLPSRPLSAALSPYSRPFSPPSFFTTTTTFPSPSSYLPSPSPNSIESHRQHRRRPSQATRRRLLAQSTAGDATPPRFLNLEKYEGDASEEEWEVLGREIRSFRKEMMMSEEEGM